MSTIPIIVARMGTNNMHISIIFMYSTINYSLHPLFTCIPLKKKNLFIYLMTILDHALRVRVTSGLHFPAWPHPPPSPPLPPPPEPSPNSGQDVMFQINHTGNHTPLPALPPPPPTPPPSRRHPPPSPPPTPGSSHPNAARPMTSSVMRPRGTVKSKGWPWRAACSSTSLSVRASLLITASYDTSRLLWNSGCRAARSDAQ